MKKFLKYVFLLAFVFGGWVLAASSLHVVRTPGADLWGYLPVKIRMVPKNTLTFNDTWVDLTKWNAADVAAHQAVATRLTEAGKAEWMKDAMLRPAPAPAPTVNVTVPPTPTAKVVETGSSTPNASAPTAPTTPTTPAPTKQTPAKQGESRPTSIFDFGR